MESRSIHCLIDTKVFLHKIINNLHVHSSFMTSSDIIDYHWDLNSLPWSLGWSVVNIAFHVWNSLFRAPPSGYLFGGAGAPTFQPGDAVKPAGDGDDEDYEPPVVEQKEVAEEGSYHQVKWVSWADKSFIIELPPLSSLLSFSLLGEITTFWVRSWIKLLPGFWLIVRARH